MSFFMSWFLSWFSGSRTGSHYQCTAMMQGTPAMCGVFDYYFFAPNRSLLEVHKFSSYTDTAGSLQRKDGRRIASLGLELPFETRLEFLREMMMTIMMMAIMM